MKKLITVLTAMMFTLILGVVFAGSATALVMDNGITVFAIGPVSYDSGPSGAMELARDGYAEETLADSENGITLFAIGPVAFDSGLSGPGAEALHDGSAAGGLTNEDTRLKVENGITIFSTEPVVSDY